MRPLPLLLGLAFGLCAAPALAADPEIGDAVCAGGFTAGIVAAVDSAGGRVQLRGPDEALTWHDAKRIHVLSRCMVDDKTLLWLQRNAP